MNEASNTPDRASTLRSVGLRIYVPALMYGLGQGAIAPVIALAARDLGASVSTAGLVVTLLGLGQLTADLPAGALAARVGERRAMLAAGLVIAASLLVCVFAPSIRMLGGGIFCIGCAGAVWMLARQAYITETVPYALRARALSTLGGANRIGTFVGPFAGAGAVELLGVRGPFLLFVLAVGIAFLVILRLPDPPGSTAGGRDRGGARAVLRTAVAAFPVLRTLGTGVLLVGAIRASRQVVIPLWAEQLGLDASTTSLVFGVAGAVDMVLFYPAGMLMDRRGRNWVAVPSMGLLGAGVLLLPSTSGLASLATVAVLIGIGNGLGSGLVMTLGADLAPADRRPEFLGAWRLCADTGNALGPVTVSAVGGAVALWAGIGTIGLVGLAAAGLLGYWIPRVGAPPSPRAAAPDRPDGRDQSDQSDATGPSQDSGSNSESPR